MVFIYKQSLQELNKKNINYTKLNYLQIFISFTKEMLLK